MKPLVILDTNVFYGIRPLLIQNVRHLLALSSRDRIRLVVPEVVLLEVARQWCENYDKSTTRLQSSLENLKGLLGSIGQAPPELNAIAPAIERAEAFAGLKEQLIAAKAEVPRWPDLPLDEIVERDLSRRKPFSDDGKGFRDFLIWRTAVESIADHPHDDSIFLVTANKKDFASADSLSVHGDLLGDLIVTRDVTYLTALDDLMAVAEIGALAEQELSLHSPVDDLDVDHLFRNAELKLDMLSGTEVAQTIGDFDYEFGWTQPLSTVLDGPSFIGFDLDPRPVITTFKTEKDDVTGIQVQFDADCHIDGYLEKSDYYTHEYSGIDIIDSDWNSHVMLGEQSLKVRITFSGEFGEQDKSNIDLQLEEIADLGSMGSRGSADLSIDFDE